MLSSSFRGLALAHGFPYLEVLRSIGEAEARRLTSMVSIYPSTPRSHSSLRLTGLVLSTGSDATDSLYQARDIIQATTAPPSAAVAFVGATVERHLRQLVIRHGIQPPASPKLSAYGATLISNEVIDRKTLHLLTRMQSLRNDAAHGNFEAVSAADGDWMIENASLLFSEYPAAVDSSGGEASA